MAVTKGCKRGRSEEDAGPGTRTKKRKKVRESEEKCESETKVSTRLPRCTTLKEYRKAVLKFLSERSGKFVHVSDITRKVKMDFEHRSLIKEKGHESPGHFILSMKKLEVKGKRVRLQQ